ncbi:hypothetical protein Peur_025667 [Populus x canadensis]
MSSLYLNPRVLNLGVSSLHKKAVTPSMYYQLWGIYLPFFLIRFILEASSHMLVVQRKQQSQALRWEKLAKLDSIKESGMEKSWLP